jgi:hypothetical protein
MIYVYRDYIHVLLVGKDSLSASIKYWELIAEALQTHTPWKLLLEERLTGVVCDKDLHDWSEFMRTVGILTGTRRSHHSD